MISLRASIIFDYLFLNQEYTQFYIKSIHQFGIKTSRQPNHIYFLLNKKRKKPAILFIYKCSRILRWFCFCLSRFCRLQSLFQIRTIITIQSMRIHPFDGNSSSPTHSLFSSVSRLCLECVINRNHIIIVQSNRYTFLLISTHFTLCISRREHRVCLRHSIYRQSMCFVYCFVRRSDDFQFDSISVIAHYLSAYCVFLSIFLLQKVSHLNDVQRMNEKSWWCENNIDMRSRKNKTRERERERFVKITYKCYRRNTKCKREKFINAIRTRITFSRQEIKGGKKKKRSDQRRNSVCVENHRFLLQ